MSKPLYLSVSFPLDEYCTKVLASKVPRPLENIIRARTDEVRVLWSFSGRVPGCGDQPGGVVLVESGDGVAEADGGACGEAGG
jgi:hypothetical protein